MGKAVKVGDIGTRHNGFPFTKVISGSPDVIIEGQPAARVDDALAPHAKPKHPPHPRTITSGSSSVFINNKSAAITGGSISCGGVTIGSGSVVIGDQFNPAGTTASADAQPGIQALGKTFIQSFNVPVDETFLAPGGLGAMVAANTTEPSAAARQMASQYADPEDRADEYQRIGRELIAAGHQGAGQWFFLAADQVDAIDFGLEGLSGALLLTNNPGDGAIDAMAVVSHTSIELSAYNFQNYLNIKNHRAISGLETVNGAALTGKALAIEIAGFEQAIAQRLLQQSLSSYSPQQRAAIVQSINERFNGPWDREVTLRIGQISAQYLANNVTVLNQRFPNHDFDFGNQQHRLDLAIGLIELQFEQ